MMSTDRILTHAAPACFVLWVFMSLIRRLIEWNAAFHNVSLYSVIPLAVMVPALFLLRSSLPKLGSIFVNTLMCFLITYSYGYFVSVLSGKALPGLYEYISAFFSLGFIFYLMWKKTDYITVFDSFCKAIFWTAFVASLYGIYQYITAPAWDMYWLASTGITSIGIPEPLGFRAFGPMSAPVVFAQLLAFALIINFSRYSKKNWQYFLASLPMIIALLLTSVRTTWLQFILGLFICLVFSPLRRQLLSYVLIGTSFFLCVGGYAAMNFNGLDTTVMTISNRLTTFSDLANDLSYEQREQFLVNTFRVAWEDPLGQGLGTVGLAAKLSDEGTTVDFDNGYLARYYETGIIGVTVFLIGLLYPLWKTFLIYVRSNDDQDIKQLCVVALATQIMLLFGMSSLDVYNYITGLFFWMSVTLISVLSREYRSIAGGDMSIEGSRCTT